MSLNDLRPALRAALLREPDVPLNYTELPDGTFKLANGDIAVPEKRRTRAAPTQSPGPDMMESARANQARHAAAQAAGKIAPMYSGRPSWEPATAPRVIRATPFVCGPISAVPRREWVFGKIAIRGEITATIAPGGVGKTAFGLAEACAMATGQNLTGVPVDKPLRVWVWNGEEPLHEMHRRVAGIHAYHELTDADFDERLFVDTGNEVELVLAEQSSKQVTIHRPVIDAMIAELRKRQIDVLIVDPFVSTHHVTENDNGAIQQAASAWKAVAVGANCAVMLAHHSRKLNGQDATAESARGGDSLVAKARSVRALNPMRSDQMKDFGVHESEGKSVFWIDPSGGKANMTARNGAREWFKMVNVPLFNYVQGNADVGDEIGVVVPWQLPDRVSPDLDPTKVEALKLRLLSQHWRAAPQSADRSDWVGVLIAEVFELDTSNEKWKSKAKALLNQLVNEGEVISIKVTSPQSRQKISVIMPASDNDNGSQVDCEGLRELR